MSDPKPTPPPRNRKARRKSSPGQVAFLDGKAVRDKAKAERKAKQRQDAHYLQTYYPEIAKAKRAKGVKNNAEQSAWRRQMFVESFADWPSVLTADEMGYRIGEWLRDPSRSVLNFRTQRRKWKWRGCEKHFVKKEASVRKKLTELKVFRYNFRLRLWFKAGSVEEAEATQRLADAEEAKRKSAPAPEGWFSDLFRVGGRYPDKAEQTVLQWCRVSTIAEVKVGEVEYFEEMRREYYAEDLLNILERECMAEAVLVAN
jgi:hypothetical protein